MISLEEWELWKFGAGVEAVIIPPTGDGPWSVSLDDIRTASVCNGIRGVCCVGSDLEDTVRRAMDYWETQVLQVRVTERVADNGTEKVEVKW